MLLKLIAMVEELGRLEKGIIAYHGSDEDFSKFDVGYLGSKRGRTPSNLSGFFFTDNKEVAQSFGKYVKTVKLSFRNPKIVDAKGKDYSEYKHKLNDIFEKIDKTKYDGLIIKNYVDSMEDEPQASTQYVVFRPEQINEDDVSLSIQKAPAMKDFFKWLGSGDNVKGSKLYRKWSGQKRRNEYKRYLRVTEKI